MRPGGGCQRGRSPAGPARCAGRCRRGQGVERDRAGDWTGTVVRWGGSTRPGGAGAAAGGGRVPVPPVHPFGFAALRADRRAAVFQVERLDVEGQDLVGPGRRFVEHPPQRLLPQRDVPAGIWRSSTRLRPVQDPFFVRVRGTDGNVSGPGSIEPTSDKPGINPWSDLWFCSNPVFVEVRGYSIRR